MKAYPQLWLVLNKDLFHGTGLSGVSVYKELDFGKRALPQSLHQIPSLNKFTDHGLLVETFGAIKRGKRPSSDFCRDIVVLKKSFFSFFPLVNLT